MLLRICVQYFALLLLLILFTAGRAVSGDVAPFDYEAARWHPSHFVPQIDETTDEQCLSCHKEILERKVLARSPAGVDSTSVLAWYQTLSTYEGPQETFHRRHLTTPLAKQLMDMKCNTCHRGNDPREEAPMPVGLGSDNLKLRKMVDPNICLMCHGAHPNELMGLPASWPEMRESFQGNCLLCHAGIRTTRHQVNYLKADAIEKAAADDGDVCYGCHGGRQWYRIAYPYARNAWKGMPEEVPDWANDRPTESAARFLVEQDQTAK